MKKIIFLNIKNMFSTHGHTPWNNAWFTCIPPPVKVIPPPYFLHVIYLIKCLMVMLWASILNKTDIFFTSRDFCVWISEKHWSPHGDWPLGEPLADWRRPMRGAAKRSPCGLERFSEIPTQKISWKTSLK